MSEVVICGTSVKVKKGDITAERTDFIVNLSNATLDQNFGVSKSILTAAGPTVKDECARLAKFPHNGYVITSAGNLKCKHIIHLIHVKPERISTFVMKVLKTCDHHDMRSVSLPAMGTGSANLDAHSSFIFIMTGIEEYLKDPTTRTNISEIVIVIFEPSVYDIYCSFFQNYKVYYHHFSACGTKIELIKGDITLQASDCVVNLTNKTLNQQFGISGAILAAAGDTVKEECRRIGHLQQGQVVITNGGGLKGKKIMHVIGPTTVPAFEGVINIILVECAKNGFVSLALPPIGTGMARIDPEESIKAILSSIIKYLSETPIPTLQTISIIVIRENMYSKYLEVFQAKSQEIQVGRPTQSKHISDPVYFVQPLQNYTRQRCQSPQVTCPPQMPLLRIRTQAPQHEVNVSLATHTRVRIHFPGTWTDTGNNEFQEVILSEDSTEYKTVKKEFLKTALPSVFVVLEIKRIQNIKLWQSFTIRRKTVRRKNPGRKNVRHLYHGTSSAVLNNINRGGFNRIYHGKNGTACGSGTYFSIGSNYSTEDRYSVPDSDGKKYVYQAAVVTGRYCQGDSSYKEPPYINDDPKGDRYDSVANALKEKTYFVVFYDDCAYPEYLITFKPHKS
ncbi:protein mono-ADP-ribosyltransferase PARP15-like [Dendropsophus ebraccatus]|uniref:protein mono-ADP-ribosyltransferase PARP15-like n=1 Tax=Dendropsophus ebraccatus TaxID=150705 RepID=UPI0038315FDB